MKSYSKIERKIDFIIKKQYKQIIASDNKMTIVFLKFKIIQLNMNNYSI